MRITNLLGLPDALVNAVKNDSYSKGDSDMSVTELLKPPRVVALEKKHADELEEDAADRIYSLMGQAMHTVLERANTVGVAERRLSIEVNGWKISGSMDLYVDGLLQDYKQTTQWKFKDGGVAPEHEQQLNCYAAILRHHGHPVHKMQIVGILRDWSKMEAFRNPDMPQRQVIVRTVPMWEPGVAEKFIHDRVVLHQQARVTLPECSFEDRWAKPNVYAVMKDGAKRATKLYEKKSEAELHAQQGPGFSVVERPGVNTRCSFYCSVSNYCQQFKLITQNEKGNES